MRDEGDYRRPSRGTLQAARDGSRLYSQANRMESNLPLLELLRCLECVKWREKCTTRISSLWGSLLSGGRYFQGVVTFGEQKPLNKLVRALFSK